MRTGALGEGVGQVRAGVAALNSADVTGQSDEQVRGEVLGLLTCLNQLTGALLDRIAVFDRRELSQADAQRASSTWLVEFGRMSKGAALRWLAHARALSRLPALADGVRSGTVSAEQLAKVAELVRHIGVERVRDFDQILAELCASAGPGQVARACERIWALVDPDGAQPDPAEDFDRREITFSRLGAMLYIRGRLDPEGAAALQTAVDALMRPPAPGDDRSAAQRRADAVVDLARGALANGELPQVGGERPQVGVLVTPEILFGAPGPAPAGCPHTTDADSRPPGRIGVAEPAAASPTTDSPADDARAGALRRQDEPAHGDPADPGCPQSTTARTATAVSAPSTVGETPALKAAPIVRAQSASSEPLAAAPAPGSRVSLSAGIGARPIAPAKSESATPSHCDCDPLTRAGVPASPQRPWLTWMGEVSPELAQRLACDGVLWRLVLDPRTGLPLDVGRKLRIVPWWMRKAIRARDRTCRWPGCDVPSEWTDAHHLVAWWRGGATAVEQILSLCRYHHGLVHEGRWTLRMDRATGEVRVQRPDGSPYELGPSRPWTSPSHQGPQPATPPGSPPHRTPAPRATDPPWPDAA